MRKDNIIAILSSELAKEEIEYIMMAYEVSADDIAEYMDKTSNFFEKINGKGISNLNIINVFISAIIKCQEEIIATNKKGQTYTMRKPSFYTALKEEYVKHIIGYVDLVDSILEDEEAELEEAFPDENSKGL